MSLHHRPPSASAPRSSIPHTASPSLASPYVHGQSHPYPHSHTYSSPYPPPLHSGWSSPHRPPYYVSPPLVHQAPTPTPGPPSTSPNYEPPVSLRSNTYPPWHGRTEHQPHTRSGPGGHLERRLSHDPNPSPTVAASLDNPFPHAQHSNPAYQLESNSVAEPDTSTGHPHHDHYTSHHSYPQQPHFSQHRESPQLDPSQSPQLHSQSQTQPYPRPMSLPDSITQECPPPSDPVVPSQPTRKRPRQLSLADSQSAPAPGLSGPPLVIAPSAMPSRPSFWASRQPDSVTYSQPQAGYGPNHTVVPAVLIREKKQKACANCRRAKLKCIVESGHAECVRCKVRKEPCVFYPRAHDEDWQQTLMADMNAATKHLANLSAAVHHILHHLVSNKVIPPFTSPDTPDGLDKYEPPERDLPNAQISQKRLRREGRDVGDEVKKKGRKAEKTLSRGREEAEDDQQEDVDEIPKLPLSAGGSTASGSFSGISSLPTLSRPHTISSHSGTEGHEPAASSALPPPPPHTLAQPPSTIVSSPSHPQALPSLHLPPSLSSSVSPPNNSPRPHSINGNFSSINRGAFDFSLPGAHSRPGTSQSVTTSYDTPKSGQLRVTPVGQVSASPALSTPKTSTSVNPLALYSAIRTSDLPSADPNTTAPPPAAVSVIDSKYGAAPREYTAQGSITVLPTHNEQDENWDSDTIIGSKDPRSDIVKKQIVSSSDALALVNYFHGHLSAFLYGYNLQFRRFPYIGGPSVITPLLLAVLCLISSERFSRLHHYHTPLADEVSLLLQTSPAESWQRFEGRYTADFGDVDGDEPLDAEFGLGPEEIVAACVLATYMTERKEAAMIARSAFRWARGWIRLLSSTPPRVTLAETAGFVPPERQASSQDMARVWLLCYIVDSTERLQLEFPAPPPRDPQSFYDILIPPHYSPSPESFPSRYTRGDPQDILLTFHARLMTILNEWRYRIKSLVSAGTVPSHDEGPMGYVESLKRLADKVNDQLDWWKDQFDARTPATSSSTSNTLRRAPTADTGIGSGPGQWSRHIEITWLFVKMSVNGTLSQTLSQHRPDTNRPQLDQFEQHHAQPVSVGGEDDVERLQNSRRVVFDSANRFMQVCSAWEPAQDLTNLSPTYLFFVTLAGSELVQNVRDWKEGRSEIITTPDDVIPLLRSVGEMLFLGELHQQHVSRTTAKTLFLYCEQLQKLR